MKRRSGRWGIALALTVLGGGAGFLGCDESSGPQNISPFLGPWTLANASLKVQCSGFDVPMLPVSGAVVATADSGGTLRLGFTDAALAGCSFLMDASGTIATVRGGQSCPIVYQGASGTFTVTAGMMTVGGVSNSLSFTGTFAGMFGPLALTCMGSFSATLTKGAPDAAVPRDGGSDGGADTAATDSSPSATEGGPGDAGDAGDAQQTTDTVTSDGSGGDDASGGDTAGAADVPADT